LSTLRRSLVALAAVAAAVVAGTALAKPTPYPPTPGGSGSEPMSGSGAGAGITFAPKYGLATYDSISGYYVLYLTPTPTECARTYLAKPPYLAIYIVTGSPLVLGAPSLQRGTSDFVDVDFYLSATHYILVQPHVKLVLTRIDTSKNGTWHGTLTVPVTHFQGKSYSFAGTFAAHWCGKVS
jgi:hypothetical protein